MSRTVNLCCMTCRESLWTGQIYRGDNGKPDIVTVYATPEDLEAHRHFHTRHLGHPLMLMDSELVDTAFDGEREHPLEFLEQDVEVMPLDQDLDSIQRTRDGLAWFDAASEAGVI